MLRPWLVMMSEPAITLIDMVAAAIIIGASLQAFVGVASMTIRRDFDAQRRRSVWLTYGRWLVAALTFQLAADIIESSIVPTWQAIGQLGAIAVIRTFLNYFLERDINEVRERQGVAPSDDSPSTH
ncbi:DUF1622 domain-containing protein [Pseudoxanthomonas sp. Root630]|uniref:DUF1622 domain-containing protein n=1 Tax=Pseudoxanthomonas sp. Root630 TaxID=1736574 RepID=UPI0007029253|nr:DUF1622 domain-containing protein [Pseudoxanthomonas sp. Root630]KRA46308.1 hypothetical protein ASD72_03595 [Pseudoxanthomonas sp. Root630]